MMESSDRAWFCLYIPSITLAHFRECEAYKEQACSLTNLVLLEQCPKCVYPPESEQCDVLVYNHLVNSWQSMKQF